LIILLLLLLWHEEEHSVGQEKVQIKNTVPISGVILVKIVILFGIVCVQLLYFDDDYIQKKQLKSKNLLEVDDAEVPYLKMQYNIELKGKDGLRRNGFADGFVGLEAHCKINKSEPKGHVTVEFLKGALENMMDISNTCIIRDSGRRYCQFSTLITAAVLGIFISTIVTARATYKNTLPSLKVSIQ
jgi:hypothetical protein